MECIGNLVMTYLDRKKSQMETTHSRTTRISALRGHQGHQFLLKARMLQELLSPLGDQHNANVGGLQPPEVDSLTHVRQYGCVERF